jgi:hypothetical protein
MTMERDFPRSCFDASQREVLWQRTLQANNVVAPNPLSEETLRVQFESYLPKLCSVDASAVLSNRTWQTFFRTSCIFRKHQEQEEQQQQPQDDDACVDYRSVSDIPFTPH